MESNNVLDFPKLAILLALPTYDAAKQDLIYFSRKDTKKNPVAEVDKFRGVLVTKVALPEAMESLGDDNVQTAHDVFQKAIREAYFAAAGEILRDYVEANKEAKEISSSAFLFANVVEKMAESATSKRLNGEQIEEWYDESETSKEASKRYSDSEEGKKKQAALKAHFLSLASNNPGIPPSLAVKMTSYVSEQDTGNNVARWVLEKLAIVAKKDSGDDL